MSGLEALPARMVRMMLPLGQTGAACYAHTPRRRVEAVHVSAPARVVLVVPRSVRAEDGAPRTVAWLAKRVAGRALYGSILCPIGKGRGLDRWVLAEWVMVKWSGGRATWKRVGTAKWVPVDRAPADVPSSDGSGAR